MIQGAQGQQPVIVPVPNQIVQPVQQQIQEDQQAQAIPEFEMLSEEEQVARLVDQVKAILKEDRFDIKRRRTIALQSARKYEEINYGRLFEDICTICQENFRQHEAILCPPCNHSFHHGCLLEVVLF